MKFLKRCLTVLVYALPAVLYCGYHPVIKLGETSSMNLELSLPLIWLVAFDLISFIVLIGYVRSKVSSKKRVAPVKHEKHDINRQSSRATKSTSTRAVRSDSPVRTGAGAGRSRRMLVDANDFGGITDRRFFLFSLFPFFATLSIFWSPNPIRAILTAGIIWLLFFAVFSLIYVLPLLELPANFKRNCLRSFLISSVIICVVCWLQCIFDVAGLTREATLMCRGCTYLSFGFPHPSGLAIEPQFMGNLLLAPTLTALYLLVFSPCIRKQTSKSRTSGSSVSALEESPELTSEDEDAAHPRRRAERTSCPKEWKRWVLVFLACLFSATLFLAFSRGAIYAYALALAVMLFFAFRRRVFRASLIAVPLTSFAFVIIAQGLFTVIGPTRGSFVDGVSRSIHQLSLGIIDLRPASSDSVDTSVDAPDTPDTSADSQATVSAGETSDETPDTSSSSPSDEQPMFTGYVAESTNTRLNLNQAALDTWLSAPGHAESGLSIDLHCHFFLPGTGPACTASAPLTPTSVLFGVGLGGAGTAMYRNSFMTHIASPKEIVQNQGISLLLELGLVGIALVIFSLLIAFCPQIFSRRFLDGKSAGTGKASPSIFWRQPALPLLISLILAYLVTLNFFSGLPNALQIYLMPPLLYLIFQAPDAVKLGQIPAHGKNQPQKS